MSCDWMDENERAIYDSQEELRIMRIKYDIILDVLRVASNALNRCECDTNKGALNYLRSKQHLWKT